MKIQRLFSWFSLAVVLLIGASAPSAVSANTEPRSVPLSPPPPATDPQQKDLPLLIEQNTEAVVLDENHRPIGKVKTAKNVASQQTARGSKITATVIAVADEEFRKAHSKDWKKRMSNAIEKADNPFQKKHQIDLQVKAYGKWKSQGSNSEALLKDLNKDWNKGKYDFVIGFTKDSRFTYGGIAYQYPQKPQKSAVSIVKDMDPKYFPHIVQHELSHNYNLGHDKQRSGIRCIMNYDYTYKTTEWDAKHNKLLKKNRTWYGR